MSFRTFHVGTWIPDLTQDAPSRTTISRATSARLRPVNLVARSRGSRADTSIKGALFGNTNSMSGRLAALLSAAAIGVLTAGPPTRCRHHCSVGHRPAGLGHRPAGLGPAGDSAVRLYSGRERARRTTPSVSTPRFRRRRPACRRSRRRRSPGAQVTTPVGSTPSVTSPKSTTASPRPTSRGRACPRHRCRWVGHEAAEFGRIGLGRSGSTSSGSGRGAAEGPPRATSLLLDRDELRLHLILSEGPPLVPSPHGTLRRGAPQRGGRRPQSARPSVTAPHSPRVPPALGVADRCLLIARAGTSDRDAHSLTALAASCISARRSRPRGAGGAAPAAARRSSACAGSSLARARAQLGRAGRGRHRWSRIGRRGRGLLADLTRSTSLLSKASEGRLVTSGWDPAAATEILSTRRCHACSKRRRAARPIRRCCWSSCSSLRGGPRRTRALDSEPPEHEKSPAIAGLSCSSWGETRTPDLTIMSRAL